MRFSWLVFLPFLQGCGLTLANLVTPDSAYDEIETLYYGTHARHTVDIFQPKDGPTKGSLVVFFYGGAWEEGNKEDYRFVAQAFTEKGYPIAIPDYRLYPEVVFPAFVEDGAAAVAAIAKQYPDKQLVLLGHSAGAYIAAMLALNNTYLSKHDVSTNQIAGWGGWSGPYDFLPLSSKTLESIFPQASRNLSQPIAFASPDAPPSLLIHGLDDTRVKPGNSQNLARTLHQLNVDVTSHYYPDVSHVGTVGSLIQFLSGWSNTLPDTLAFIESL